MKSLLSLQIKCITVDDGWMTPVLFIEKRCDHAKLFYSLTVYMVSLPSQWRHNVHDGVSNHQPRDCLLNRVFRHRTKKTSKLHAVMYYHFTFEVLINVMLREYICPFKETTGIITSIMYYREKIHFRSFETHRAFIRKIVWSGDALTILTLLMLQREYSELLGQYHACWCPAQGINRHGIDSTGSATWRVAPLLIWSSSVQQHTSYDTKCEYIFHILKNILHLKSQYFSL